jgi:hypothetical protein
LNTFKLQGGSPKQGAYRFSFYGGDIKASSEKFLEDEISKLQVGASQDTKLRMDVATGGQFNINITDTAHD